MRPTYRHSQNVHPGFQDVKLTRELPRNISWLRAQQTRSRLFTKHLDLQSWTRVRLRFATKSGRASLRDLEHRLRVEPAWKILGFGTLATHAINACAHIYTDCTYRTQNIDSCFKANSRKKRVRAHVTGPCFRPMTTVHGGSARACFQSFAPTCLNDIPHCRHPRKPGVPRC